MPDALHSLELTLWRVETRYDCALMDATFASDFHEFGRSGRRYTRADLLVDSSDARAFEATLHDFTTHLLSPDIAHCTYISEVRSQTGTEWANRSSLWVRTDGRWQLRFHQGTPLPPPTSPALSAFIAR